MRMQINIELLGDNVYRVRPFARSRLVKWLLGHVSVNVSHVSAIGECAWIDFEDVTDKEQRSK